MSLISACELGDVDELGDLDEETMTSSSESELTVDGLHAQHHSLHVVGSSVLGKESLNGLEPGRLHLNKDASDGLENTAKGRGLLKYIATCALPRDMELSFVVDGNEYAYPGLLNLAPDWVAGECDSECQGWMSACLLAHANIRGEEIAISLRGAHPSLTPTAEEESIYNFEEGAFYGQLFNDDPKLYACIGDDVFRDPSSGADLMSRLCSRGACGVTRIGASCGYNTVTACAKENPYSDCLTINTPNDGPRLQEVITVFLKSR